MLRVHRHLCRAVTCCQGSIRAAGSSSRPVIAIRREDNSVWERRAPFSPVHVRELINRHGVKVIVQPSNRRAFALQVFLERQSVNSWLLCVLYHAI